MLSNLPYIATCRFRAHLFVKGKCFSMSHKTHPSRPPCKALYGSFNSYTNKLKLMNINHLQLFQNPSTLVSESSHYHIWLYLCLYLFIGRGGKERSLFALTTSIRIYKEKDWNYMFLLNFALTFLKYNCMNI